MITLRHYEKDALKEAAVKLCSELIDSCLNSQKSQHCTFIQNNLDPMQFDYLKLICEKFGVYVKMTEDGMVKLSIYKFVAKNTYEELFRHATAPIDFSNVEDHQKRYVITPEPFVNKLNSLQI